MKRHTMRLLCGAGLIAGLFPGSLLASPASGSTHTWQLVTSSQEGGRFVTQALGAPHAATQPLETETAVFVNTKRQFQKVFGFGGAVTDATAEVYAKLTPESQQAFLTAYFDPRQGLGYSVLRTTIHSSDFGTESYTYVRDGDRALTSFSIEHDMKYRIPLLRQALAAGRANGSKMHLFASPWSAPAWMKTNNEMLHGGSLRPEYAEPWAQYMVKFVQAYEKAGIPLWGLSVQNEPMAKQPWESMIYTADEEASFLSEHLGPALKKAGLGDKKIIVWDHNRDLLPQRAERMLDDPKVRQYVWGVGYHWYETWAKGEPMHRNLAAMTQAYPDVNFMLTESEIENFDATKLQLWDHGERYGREMIADLNAGSIGWVDWNLLLDSRGGPNHVGNLCFAPIHATDDGKLVFTPSYTYIGHFARYIRPDAQRVSATSSRSTLDTTAFVNADGQLAVVVMNKTDQPQHYRLSIDHMEVPVDIPAHAIQTVLR